MLRNLRLHRVRWAVTGLLALVAAVTGVAVPGIYAGVVAPDLVPGAFSQDIISVAASVVLIAVALAGGNEPALGLSMFFAVIGALHLRKVDLTPRAGASAQQAAHQRPTGSTPAR